MDALLPPSDSNLVKNLIFIEWDTGDDIRASFAFTLLFRRGDLLDLPVKSDDSKVVNKRYHAQVRGSLLRLI